MKDFFPAGISRATINILLGLLIAAYPLSQFFSAPILGKYSDRYGRKKILLISLTGSLIGYLLFGIGILLSNVYLLFVSRIIDGITGGNISIVYSAIADISTRKNKTKNFGLTGMAFGLGFIFGPFLGGVLSNSDFVSWFDLATPFWFSSLLVVGNILFVVFLLKESIRTKVHKKIHLFDALTDIKRVINLKSLRTLFLVIFLVNFGWAFFTQFFQVFLFDVFTYSSAQIGYLFAYMGFWVALSQGVIIRPISSRFKSRYILNIAIVMTSLLLALFLFPGKSYFLYIIIPFLALFFGFIQPNFSTIISNATASDAQGEVLGLRQSVISFAQIFPPILAGISLTMGSTMPIIISSCILFVAWLIFVFLYKESPAHVSF